MQSNFFKFLVSPGQTPFIVAWKNMLFHSQQLGSKEMSRSFKFFAFTDGEIQFYCYTSSPNELVQRHTVDNLVPKEKVSDE